MGRIGVSEHDVSAIPTSTFLVTSLHAKVKKTCSRQGLVMADFGVAQLVRSLTNPFPSQ